MTPESERRPPRRRVLLQLCILGALSAGLIACSRERHGPARPTSGRTSIRFATDWKAQAEQGGFYEALADGDYARRGLDVRIIQGGPATNTAELLAAGAADLGIGSNSFGVMNLAAEHVPVKAVMAVFQKDPQVLIAHSDSGTSSMADLRGRPILLSDSAITSFWLWLKAKFGYTDAQVRKYSFSSAPFLADKRAVQEGYVTSEPYTIAKQSGAELRVFLLADQGYPGYAGMVLAPDKLIAANPKAVQAFVEASAIGWKRYLEGDARPADALIRTDNPDMSQDVLDQAREKMRTYALVDSGEAAQSGVGVMSDAHWKRFFDMASGLGVYPKTLDYHQAYTTAFIGTLPFVAKPGK